MKPHEHLDAVKGIIEQRGKERDLPEGERSMERAVAIFNVMTGRDLWEAEGWKFMMALKLSRQQAGSFKLDDYHDLIGYAALLAECAEETASIWE
jgi:hypothetical protein